jgi:hypothetical protein
MAYADEVLADSPLAYWKLNDASGATAADSSGNSRPATYVNTPEAYNQAPILAGTSNNVSFESGGTDYLTIADAAWQSGMGALSLEQVIRPETVLGAGAWHQWFAKTNGGTYSFWSGCVNDGGTHKLGFAVASASAANLGLRVEPGRSAVYRQRRAHRLHLERRLDGGVVQVLHQRRRPGHAYCL